MLNNVQLIGRLGRDPESNKTPSGDLVSNFSIACSDRWTDKSGERQESVEWVRVVAWRKLAEICEKYLEKGRLVYVEGKLKTRKYTGKDGVERTSTEVHAMKMLMLGDRGAGSQGGGQQQEQQGTGAPVPADDDLPF